MNKAALSVQIFGLYLIGLGAWLLLAPNVLLRIFGMAATDEVWIRVVGMLVGFLGTYYVRAAAARFTPFFAWTIPVRLSAFGFFGAFVLLGLERVRADLDPYGVVEQFPKMEGRQMVMVISPAKKKPAVAPVKKAPPKPAEPAVAAAAAPEPAAAAKTE